MNKAIIISFTILLVSCASRLAPTADISPFGKGEYLLVLSGNFMGSGSPCGSLPRRYDDSDYIVLPNRVGIFDAANIGLYFDHPQIGGDPIWKEKDVAGTVKIDEREVNVSLRFVRGGSEIVYKYNGNYTLKDMSIR